MTNPIAKITILPPEGFEYLGFRCANQGEFVAEIESAPLNMEMREWIGETSSLGLYHIFRKLPVPQPSWPPGIKKGTWIARDVDGVAFFRRQPIMASGRWLNSRYLLDSDLRDVLDYPPHPQEWLDLPWQESLRQFSGEE